jgi:hypothetical protein
MARDLRLKEALLGAHQKFKPNPEIDELNVLFLACGDFYKMSEWHGYLLGQGGLFTGDPFHLPATFCNVDCLILSNVKYRHQVAFNFPAWSLGDVFMVPLQNPHRRKNVFDSTVAEGLSVFKHYGKEFFADRIVRSGAEEIQEMIAPQTKVTWFVDRHLCKATALIRPYWISRSAKPALLLSFPDTSPDYHRRSDVGLAYFQAKLLRRSRLIRPL